MATIEIEHLSDRELLVLAVKGVNSAVERLDRQNGRIRNLEDWRNIIVGGLGVLTLAVVVGVPLAIKLIA